MTKVRKIITTFVATATIVGGLVVGFATPEPLTWDELNTMIAVQNYEIELAGGSIILDNVKGNSVDLLNVEILKRDVLEDSVTIDGEILTKEDYKILRSGLIKRYDGRSLIGRMLP